MNQREIFLNKKLSEEISTKKNLLEKKLKTKGKLTLEESITLEMYNLLISRGWGELSVPNQNIKRSDDESLLHEFKEELLALDRQELIHRLSLATLKIEKLQEIVNRDNDVEYQFLLSKFSRVINKRIEDALKKSVKRKTGKAAIHEKKVEMAEVIISQMRDEYQKIEASHAREFYRRLREKCAAEGIPKLSGTTLSNYFKKITGLQSTK